jgi:hypothetical protein
MAVDVGLSGAAVGEFRPQANEELTNTEKVPLRWIGSLSLGMTCGDSPTGSSHGPKSSSERLIADLQRVSRRLLMLGFGKANWRPIASITSGKTEAAIG